jgi:phosphoribosylaminoimidazole-succinocarboxamide synthase
MNKSISAESLTMTNCPELNLVHRGKVRDMYHIPGHNDKLLMVATDRISAYDVVMDDPIPGKGRTLTEMSLFWFNLLDDIVENHLITADVDEFPDVCRQYRDQLEGRSMLVKKTKPLPVECIVRGYISGSMWGDYQKSIVSNGRYKIVLGRPLPVFMQESEAFLEPIFTPSTKAAAGEHDINFQSKAAAVNHLTNRPLKKGTRSYETASYLYDDVQKISLDLYSRAATYARGKGIIIADTKFEIGLDEDGHFILIDEVLTPDSSRFWPADKYLVGQGQPSFDKQFLRDYLTTLVKKGEWDKNPPAPELPEEIVLETSNRYHEALQLLTR